MRANYNDVFIYIHENTHTHVQVLVRVLFLAQLFPSILILKGLRETLLFLKYQVRCSNSLWTGEINFSSVTSFISLD